LRDRRRQPSGRAPLAEEDLGPAGDHGDVDGPKRERPVAVGARRLSQQAVAAGRQQNLKRRPDGPEHRIGRRERRFFKLVVPALDAGMRAVRAVAAAEKGAERHGAARDRRGGERREAAVAPARRFVMVRPLAASALQALLVGLV
jgi:hypothetical protein